MTKGAGNSAGEELSDTIVISCDGMLGAHNPSAPAPCRRPASARRAVCVTDDNDFQLQHKGDARASRGVSVPVPCLGENVTRDENVVGLS
ncbi:hypothetical protein [Sorangium sp. So ce542]|uniref:hypothetical protein n=1 Tax=Sorangium sp. So ce542 TaxID=3133316 RepID=UPI003F5E9FB4